jgi:adenylosuccinate synthase
VGLSPRLVSEVVIVFRTFPIRVTGIQAGPLHQELTWEELQSESRSPIPLHEYTSVTHKMRRVGRFDWEQARLAATLNRPTRIALNFTDHLDFANRGSRCWSDLDDSAKNFVREIEKLGAPVCYIGTGPQLDHCIQNQRPEGTDVFRRHVGKIDVPTVSTKTM